MPGKFKKGQIEWGGWTLIELIIGIAVMAIILLILGFYGKPIAAWIGKTVSGLFGG